MYSVMTIFADRYQPFNRLLSNIYFGVFFMMDLSSASAAIHATPVIPPKYHVALPLPFPGLKVGFSVVVRAMLTLYFKCQTF